MIFILWSLFGFLFGALPFSVWIGQFILQKDIRDYGDHNPGATNVLRAGGFPPYALALALDISKGAIPVGLAYQIFGIQGWQILPVALAPALGHAFSPFLNWRGGKAIAAIGGIWIGLTLWKIPLVGLLFLSVGALFIKPSGWAVLLMMGGILIPLSIWLPDKMLIGVWLTQVPLILWTHRADLSQRPTVSLPRKSEPEA